VLAIATRHHVIPSQVEESHGATQR